MGTVGPGSGGAPERPVRHSGRASWHAVYRLVIGFCLVPVAGWWWGDGAATWRLVLSFLFVLVMLRIVPAVVRHVLPFPQDVKAEWARERLLAKRFDSYQWRKLLWLGLGLVAHLLIAGRALAVPSILALTCLVGGGLGTLRWRRLVRSGRVAGVDAAASTGSGSPA